MKRNSSDRRRYLRLEAPVGLRIITERNEVDNCSAVNISPLGLRYETGVEVRDGEALDLTLILPNTQNPVHIQGKIVWHRESTKAKSGHFDVGCEFSKIEEDNKNTFLKYYCDLLYHSSGSGKEEE